MILYIIYSIYYILTSHHSPLYDWYCLHKTHKSRSYNQLVSHY